MDARVTRMKKFLRKIFQVTPAAGGGTQDANCEAPERTSPTSWRDHAEGSCRREKKLPPQKVATTSKGANVAKEFASHEEVVAKKGSCCLEEFTSQEGGWSHAIAKRRKKVDNLAAIHPYYDICSIKTTDLRCLSSSQQLQERYRELRSRHASCRGARMKRREKPTPQVFPVALHSGNQ